MRPMGQSDCVLNEAIQRVWRGAFSTAQHIMILRISISSNNIWNGHHNKPNSPHNQEAQVVGPDTFPIRFSHYVYLWVSYCLHKSLWSVSPLSEAHSHAFSATIYMIQPEDKPGTLYKCISCCFNNELVVAKQCFCLPYKSLSCFLRKRKKKGLLFGFS